MRHVSIMCKRLEQVVNDVMLIGDAVEFLTDEKYFNAFEKYDIAFFFYFDFLLDVFHVK